MFIIKNKKIFIGISITLVVLSIICISVFGVKLGIDFKGGTAMEISYTQAPNISDIQKITKDLNIGEVLIQESGENNFIIKTRSMTEPEHQILLSALSFGDKKVQEKSYSSIGPSVGKELKQKAIVAILLVMLAIILFIAYAFRKVSNPVSSWKYGFIAIVTLVHDIAIPTGFFALMSHFMGAEADTLFVVALLTVLGLSVSDTIVVFDRIRENIKGKSSTVFSEIVGTSLNQTFVRSINTSLTVILVLLALAFFGPVSTKIFAIVLAIGLFFGTYSSIFLASPLLVIVEGWQKKKNKK